VETCVFFNHHRQLLYFERNIRGYGVKFFVDVLSFVGYTKMMKVSPTGAVLPIQTKKQQKYNYHTVNLGVR